MDVFIYPNPATDQVSINLGKEMPSFRVVISDLSGTIVYADNYHHTNEVTIGFEKLNLRPGMYFVSLLMNNSKPFTCKLSVH